MKTRAITALLTVAGATSCASAQWGGFVLYDFSLNGGGSEIVVSAGESVNVRVMATMLPTNPASVCCLADGKFDIGADASGSFAGSWSNLTIPAPYNFLYGIATTAGTPLGHGFDGVVFGTGAPWFVPPPPGLVTNPDDVWSGTCSVSQDAAPGSVLALYFPHFEWTNVWSNMGGYGGFSMPAFGTTGTITVRGCYADCNANSVLTINDFTCFQVAFAEGDPYADCDGNTQLTVADFTCFQGEFLAGCP